MTGALATKKREGTKPRVSKFPATMQQMVRSGNYKSSVANQLEHFFVRSMQQYLSQLEDIGRRNVGSAVGSEALIREFDVATDNVIEAGQNTVKELRTTDAKRVKTAFRRIIAPYMVGNPLMERALAKPRGYPGDYLMMEHYYNDRVDFKDGLCGFFDKYALSRYGLIKARKVKIKKILAARLLSSKSLQDKWYVCSMGAGSGREWVEIQSEIGSKVVPGVQLTYIDWDAEALAYAKNRLRHNRIPEAITCVAANLLKFSESKMWDQHVGRYHLVYSLGVANYFYDTTLGIILNTGFRLLRPGGELIVTHKASETFDFTIPDWLCDWTFVQRSKEDFSRCFQEALTPFRGQYEWRLEWEAQEEMFGVAKRLA